MDILGKIVKHKIKEVEERKSLYPLKLLEKSIYFDTVPVSLRKYILRADKSGVIAEFKTKSPSKGSINPYVDVESVTVGYMQAGASALSILTDSEYFGGGFENLKAARKYNYCPILQKDFILDEYQVVEAKSAGADAILLIAAILDRKKIRNLASKAHCLGMEVLLEIHSEGELDMINEFTGLVGVNNRNLRTFKTDIDHSISLAGKMPVDMIKISESGINRIEDIIKLKNSGFDGFLIGDNFMQSADPGRACRDFIKQLRRAEMDKSKPVANGT